MKTDPNKSATGFGFSTPVGHCIPSPGLSIRAELAARMMQGLIASGDSSIYAYMARNAVMAADALIAELNKEQ